jgi:hypothetical protein
LFEKSTSEPDNDDINIPPDQPARLAAAIANELSYPKLDENGYISHDELYAFLEKLCIIFNWEKHERETLGYTGKNWTPYQIDFRTQKPKQKYGRLNWYSVILSQWLQVIGLGLSLKTELGIKKTTPIAALSYRVNKLFVMTIRYNTKISLSLMLSALAIKLSCSV